MDEFKKQQIINDKVYVQKLTDDAVVRLAAICIKCFNELLKQKVFNKKVYDQKLMDDAVKNLARDSLQKNMEWMVT